MSDIVYNFNSEYYKLALVFVVFYASKSIDPYSCPILLAFFSLYTRILLSFNICGYSSHFKACLESQLFHHFTNCPYIYVLDFAR